jgi:hypothetical protein
MPKGVKILLIVLGGLLLIVVGLAGGAYWWFTSHLDKLKADGEQAMAEGTAFAAGKTRNECVTEGVARSGRCDGMMCEVKNRFFVKSCLGAAADVPGFCQGVPPKSEIMKSVQWSLSRCQGGGGEVDQRCSRVMSEVQEFCNPDTH